MSNPSPQLILTGIVYSLKQVIASVGDAAVHPGASRTSFIDATIYDGSSWRALDLGGFGFGKGARGFDHSAEIGPLMRQISQSIASRKGQTVYYEIPAGGTRRKYCFRGISFVSVFPGRQNFF